MEHEIQAHAKKAYNKWKDPGSSFWEKLKEIAMEVAIIVFAVSVSIWFHNMSEKRHQRHEVKEFLLGLKEDLTGDIKEMEADKESYAKQKAAYIYITSLKIKEVPSKDSLSKYNADLFTSSELLPNNGRFEGFKSSGKIGTIENKILQNDIMDVYQEDIPVLLLNTKYYINNKQRLGEFVNKNLKRVTDSTSNFRNIIVTDEGRNICNFLSNTDQITQRYDICINKMKKIIAEINKEYNLK
jgi:hypothetical protein